MPIDPKVLSEYIGLDLSKMDKEEEARAAFDAAFLRKDKAHADKEVAGRVFGQVNNVLRGRLKSFGKDHGVDLGKVDEIDPVDLITTLSDGVKGHVAKLTADLDALKKAGEGKGDTKEFEQKLASIAKERDAFGASAKEWEKKYLDLDATVKAKDAAAKVDEWWAKAEGSVKFRDDVSPLTRRGFMASVREKYRPDFDGDTVKVLDANGGIVMDKKRAQTFASINDLLIEAANAERLTVESSPAGGKPVARIIGTIGTAPPGMSPAGQGRGTRPVMPR